MFVDFFFFFWFLLVVHFLCASVCFVSVLYLFFGGKVL
jgi:hypothetical protein